MAKIHPTTPKAKKPHHGPCVKRRVPSKTQATKKADKLYSLHRRTTVGKCENCGRSHDVQLQLAHIITRGCRKLRYSDDNTMVLCSACHRNFHNKPLEFSEFVKNKKGQYIFDHLIRESNNLSPISLQFYLDVIEQYK